MIGESLVSQAMMTQIDRTAGRTANLAAADLAYKNKNDPKAADKADAAAKDFESLFISQMLEHMFGESLGSDFFGSDDSADVYRQMMVQQFGQKISASGGIGIADYVKRELLKFQEV